MNYKSEVYAGKVDMKYNVVTDIPVYLGEIEFSSLKEAFVKTIRMYNKNARKHIYHPQFKFNGRVYYCWEYGDGSKKTRSGKYTEYWVLAKCRTGKGWALFETGPRVTNPYFMLIKKSRVNMKDAKKYVESLESVIG